jgi:hypothetical protein
LFLYPSIWSIWRKNLPLLRITITPTKKTKILTISFTSQ